MTKFSETVVLGAVLAAAGAAKAVQMIDASTTVGVAASAGVGMFAGGSLCYIGLLITRLSNTSRRT